MATYTYKSISRSALWALVMLTVFAAAFFAVPAAPVSAEASSIQAPTSVTRGSEITVTVSISAEDAIEYVGGNLSYDNSAAFVSSNCVQEGGEGVLAVKYNPPDATSTSVELTFTFSATTEGSCGFGFSGYAFSADGIVLAAPELSTTVNITERTGGLLTSLVPSTGELLPAFSPEIYDYVLKVESDVQYVDFSATTLSDTDVIEPESLRFWSLDDPNAKKITVTDASGGQRIYNVTIIREPSEDESGDESSDSEAESTDEPASIDADSSEAAPSEADESPAASQAETAPQEPQQPDEGDNAQPDNTEKTEEDNSSQQANVFSVGSDSSKDSGVSSLRRTLMPALLIALAVLILALFILIYWLKNRSERRRKKIKSSHKGK